MNLGEVLSVVIGAVIAWAFLYSRIYFAVKAAIQDAPKKRIDPDTGDKL